MREPFVMPTTLEEVEKLSWGQLLYLAGDHADELGRLRAFSPALSWAPTLRPLFSSAISPLPMQSRVAGGASIAT